MTSIDESVSPAWSDRTLRIFSSAARHGSLSAAARTLGIGQPAVSHAVSRLESIVGRRVFTRSRAGVSLTPVGQALYDKVSESFALIDLAMAEAMGSAKREAVTVSVSTSLASYWLMPRLPAFKLEHPDIELRVLTSDSDDAVGSDADLWIPLGPVSRPGLSSVPLCAERIVPVASPGLAASLDDISPQALRDAPLLHLEERYVPRFNWNQWFVHHEVEPPERNRASSDAYRSNDYSVILQAAIAGQGVALGWLHIVADCIATNQLVPLAAPIETDSSFEIFYRSQIHMRGSVTALYEWLQLQMAPSDHRASIASSTRRR
ncbi:MAG: LysR family transcriptional regulator [Actinobacteria bacterium]|nr:LysR family transcriptional regulator [Actinomycetota bacterium]